MSDVFVEQLVKREKNKQASVKKVVYIFLALVFSVLIFLFVPSLALFLIPLVWMGVYFLLRRENLEFEYIFTSGILDIDKIINQTSRKRLFSIDVREIHIMVKKSAEVSYGEFKNFNKEYDFSSGLEKENTYVFIFKHEQELIKIIFEPDEKVLKSIRMYIANKIKN